MNPFRAIPYFLLGLVGILSASPLMAREISPELASEYPERDPREPLYTYIRPKWAFEFSAAMRAFGTSELAPGQNAAHNYTNAVNVSFQYEPPFIQRMGVISLGPTLGIYPVPSVPNLTATPFSIFHAGGQALYQARFFHEQILVPVAGYEYDLLNYRTLNAGNVQTGRMTLSGPVYGVWIYLNFFEPSSAAQMYADHEIVRSYLAVEARNLSGSGGDGPASLTISGASYFMGFRLEF